MLRATFPTEEGRMRTHRIRSVLAVAAVTATFPALAAGASVAAVAAPANGGLTGTTPGLPSHFTHGAVRQLTPAVVVVSGLDNPRQLAWDRSGRLLVAEAGHGSYGRRGTCFTGGEGKMCVGRSGKITRVAHPATATNRTPNRIARGFLSAAGTDGTSAVGSDGVSQGRSRRIFVQETHVPAAVLRSAGIRQHQNGKLLTLNKGVVANISRYEFRHNPDGENVDSDPYAVLALRNHKLVADAAADDILRVQGGRLSVWALLPGDTRRIDPVPTSLARGPHGSIYVGTLFSLVPHKARVLQYGPRGRLLRSWYGFTSVTGVAASASGHIYVSELFAGCPPGAGPSCIPGRVVDIAPNGTRTKMRVPFPAGLALRNGHLYVSAWSIAPARGAFGNPAFSGQVWRLR
jgi:hypothetical protein